MHGQRELAFMLFIRGCKMKVKNDRFMEFELPYNRVRERRRYTWMTRATRDQFMNRINLKFTPTGGTITLPPDLKFSAVTGATNGNFDGMNAAWDIVDDNDRRAGVVIYKEKQGLYYLTIVAEEEDVKSKFSHGSDERAGYALSCPVEADD